MQGFLPPHVKNIDNSSKKKPKSLYCQRFIPKYTELWPCLIKVIFSKLGDEYSYYCTQCKSDFLIGHGVKHDCKRHVDSKMHKQYVEKENVKAKQRKLVLVHLLHPKKRSWRVQWPKLRQFSSSIYISIPLIFFFNLFSCKAF